MAVLGDFTYSKQITFDTSAAGANVASAQANFPVCVHINSSSWPTAGDRTAFFNATYNPLGKRVQFYDANGTTNLDYEVEYYDVASQEAVYWVRKPSVAGNSTTDHIHLGYGNDPNESDQDNKTGVWDANFMGVWHLGDNAWGSSPEAKDSTSNSCNGTNVGSTDETGKVRKGRHFVTDDKINCGRGALNLTGTALTISASYNLHSTGDYPVIAGISAVHNDSTDQYTIQFSAATGKVRFAVKTNVALYQQTEASDSGTGAWFRVAGVYDGSNIYTYREGAEVTHKAASGNIQDSGINFAIGGAYYPSKEYPLHGVVDEVRVSNIGRSADWIKLEHYSIKKTNFNGDSWLTFGTPTTVSVSTQTLTFSIPTKIAFANLANPVRIFEHGQASSIRNHCTSIIKTNYDGHIWAIWAQSDTVAEVSTTTRIVGKHSSDNGVTWGDITTIHDSTDIMDWNPACLQDGNRIFLFWNRRTDGLESPSDLWWKYSDDGGHTWSDAAMHTDGSRGLRSNGIVMSNGDRILPAYITGYCYILKCPVGEDSTNAANWDLYTSDTYANMSEPTICEIADNNILIYCRVNASANQRKITFNNTTNAFSAISDSGIASPDAPVNLLRLGTGDLQRLRNTQTYGQARNPLVRELSDDDGASWGSQIKVVDSIPADTVSNHYAGACETGGRNLLIIYNHQETGGTPSTWNDVYVVPITEYDTGTKSVESVLYASVKKIEGVAIANVKEFESVA